MMNSSEIPALIASIVLLTAAVAAAGLVYHPEFRVATGESMEPTIEGPAIVHCPTGEFTSEDIDEGDIVAVNPSDADRFNMNGSSGVVIHRVTFIDDDITPANIKTKGDNEISSDGYSSIENVECLYQSHVELPG